MYKESITEPEKFFGNMARELLSWERDFQTVKSGTLAGGDTAWFLEGRLNASYNCVDRHAFKNPDKPAIIYEADEKDEGRIITYGELLRDASKLAWTLKQMGVQKGDTVAIYLPMIPEAVVAFLACARIGAVHSVVFAGFSSDSLRDRILDANSKVVITTDEGKRGGKTIGTKKIVDEALKQCPIITHCLVAKRTGAEVPWTDGRDLWWHEETEKWPSYYPPESMNSEDPLFLLYTSGSTGKPKGVMHTTGGYLFGAAATGKYVFDIHDSDRFFCGGDVGWITGHTYVVYAPLLLGVATVVFEGTPAYPDFSRYWDVCEKHSVTQFYVAPTALRLLKRAGDQHVKHEMKSLRVLGSVGEPIAAEVWKWYHEIIGKTDAHVIDVSVEGSVFEGLDLGGILTFFPRRTGKPKPAPTSSPQWAVSHPPSQAAPRSHSSASSPPSSTPSPAKRSTAMMSRVSSRSSKPGHPWRELFTAHTRDTWTRISMCTRATISLATARRETTRATTGSVAVWTML